MRADGQGLNGARHVSTLPLQMGRWSRLRAIVRRTSRQTFSRDSIVAWREVA
jgi:hypothetical protein